MAEQKDGGFTQIDLSRSDGIATITLNHPPVNVMTSRMMEEIGQAFSRVEKEGRTHAIVIRGAGRCFSAGADVREHLPDQAPEMIRSLHRLVESVMGLKTPLVAVLHGTALGGAFEFATLADVVLVQEGCRLGLPEIRLGSFPPVAAAFYPAMIGWKHALEVLLTGDTISPERACELGLATAVLPAGRFEEEVEKRLARIRSLSLPVLKLCKMATLGGFVQRPLEALSTAETIYVQELLKTRDAREGLEAFLQKRAPVWEHR